MEGPEIGVDVGTSEVKGGAEMGSASVSGQVSSDLHGPELKSGGKVKVKMPKFFGKSKAKGGSAADLTMSSPDIELTRKGEGVKVSKDLSLSSGELQGGKMSVGGSTELRVTSKTKSASLDLFKKSRHRSSSFSDEGGLASPTSASGDLEAGSGDISIDLGGGKVKGKKGKLKFGTFGGFGSKSKGSYEVSLGEQGEGKLEGGSDVALSSKKSRMSSSSSSDSGSKSGFHFPRVELAVAKK